ncbi:MAG: ArsR family transcriptional regulator [Candidatus Hydrogenedens sp.]|nr:ArsR family transcriptional regulator [Candidatus Hydrogenedens sp.]
MATIDKIGRVVREQARLTLLRLLSEMPGYAANTSLLDDALVELGVPIGRDKVETEAAWLAEQDLVAREVKGPVTKLTLTRRGRDCATGMVEVPGVKRPSPDDPD